jgi:hypothetical protein
LRGDYTHHAITDDKADGVIARLWRFPGELRSTELGTLAVYQPLGPQQAGIRLHKVRLPARLQLLDRGPDVGHAYRLVRVIDGDTAQPLVLHQL